MSNLYVDNIDPYSSWTGTEIAGNTVSPPGAVLQVVQGVKTDAEAYTHADTNEYMIPSLSAAIIPANTSSKILVTLSLNMVQEGSHNAMGYNLKCNHTGSYTSIFQGDADGDRMRYTGAATMRRYDYSINHTGITYLHSPNISTEIFYRVAVQDGNGDSGVSYINRGEVDTDLVAVNRLASSITLMEIAG